MVERRVVAALNILFDYGPRYKRALGMNVVSESRRFGKRHVKDDPDVVLNIRREHIGKDSAALDAGSRFCFRVMAPGSFAFRNRPRS